MSTLAERYGSSATSRNKALVALVAVLVGAGLSWLAWVMLEHGRPEAQSAPVGYDVTGPHAAVATFEVIRRDSNIAASCLVRAFAEDHTIVGEANVEVGPGGPTRQRLVRTVRTEREATSVEIVGCTTPDQSRRR